MGSLLQRALRHAPLFCLVILMSPFAHAAIPWQVPTPEELSMTSQPEVPGASAVVLFHEELVEDTDGTWTYYTRIKILNRDGRDHYSNITIQYPSGPNENDFNVTNFAARTIHSDGTVIPFSGAPFDRLVENSANDKTREKVFSLPDVQIGSIVEYRYTLQLNADLVTYGVSTEAFIPTFYAQSDLFTRKEHFLWHTNRRPVGLTSSLPGGSAAVKIKEVNSALHYSDYTVSLDNVPPVPDEPFMPPLRSLVQKVVFYTALLDSFRTAQDFWQYSGKNWSKGINDFIGPPSRLAPPATEITAGASTPLDKLRKLYAAVQQMQNTNFSRDRSAHEKKVTGIAAPKSALDVLQQKRGDDFQLTILFVGLARAAGFNAYIMSVANRKSAIFDPAIITFRQLNDDLAIVELDGKELFLDPAEPLCPFGQLLWSHSYAGGLRQTSTGVALAVSNPPVYKDADTRRVANLTIDDTGHASGTVDMAFSGAPALRWRQSTLLGDETALHQDLEKYLLDLVPKGSEVTLTSVDNLHDADKPLIVHFNLSGQLANVTSKSAFVPAQLFHANDTSPFPDTKRTLPIDFFYPEAVHEAVSLRYPPSWHIDNPPAPESDVLPKIVGCNYRAELAPAAIILHRDFVLGTLTVDPSRYPDVRSYYEKVTAADHATLLFHTHPASTPTP